jgi:hypothetical protein
MKCTDLCMVCRAMYVHAISVVASAWHACRCVWHVLRSVCGMWRFVRDVCDAVCVMCVALCKWHGMCDMCVCFA